MNWRNLWRLNRFGNFSFTFCSDVFSVFISMNTWRVITTAFTTSTPCQVIKREHKIKNNIIHIYNIYIYEVMNSPNFECVNQNQTIFKKLLVFLKRNILNSLNIILIHCGSTQVCVTLSSCLIICSTTTVFY